ncbi:Histidine kinase [Nocardioides alpinus]|uniref:histidine kinase n=1 Tax=Nocardioides alpinus TaxID=748909 RepID=A0A1I0W283_9ACTN|nr:Histidine kinase [Nocardioides alpinus]
MLPLSGHQRPGSQSAESRAVPTSSRARPEAFRSRGGRADTDVMTTVSASTARMWPPDRTARTGVSGEVLAALAVLSAGVLPALLVLPHDRVVVDVNLPLLGWLPLGVAGVLLLDRVPRSAVAWAAVVVAAATPMAMLLTALPSSTPAAAVGPWWLTPLLAVAVAALPATGRSARRWRGWIVGWSVAAVGSAAVAWQLGTRTTFGVVATLGLLAVAATLVASAYVRQPRPPVEPLVDVALLVGVLASGVVAGGLMWSFSERERIFGAEVVGVLAAAVTLMMATPAAISVRRGFLARRYGTGLLTPSDLTLLSGGLRTTGDPRALLGTAGELVAAASGVAGVEIVLDEIDDRPGWTAFPLVVGDERVGTMAVRPRDPEGLEARQEHVVRQLAPTVALAARAVDLAVEAQHARNDVIREREAERARILADLHDDLGPALAGMSMRVEAARATEPSEELTALAGDLTACRADLRRIVSALTPEPLVGADLSGALHTLVSSFGTADGAVVELEAAGTGDVDGAVAIVVYRFVAEAVTNALRHAGPSRVLVRVCQDGRSLRASVEDDGRGGPVVPGVGLTSLGTRAREIGGRLDVEPGPSGGLVVSLVVPGWSG